MDYNEYSVYELRNYARNLGVKSPTTKKKQELINEINYIKENNIINTTSNLGRPPKYLYLNNDLMERKQNILKIQKMLMEIQKLLNKI